MSTGNWSVKLSIRVHEVRFYATLITAAIGIVSLGELAGLAVTEYEASAAKKLWLETSDLTAVRVVGGIKMLFDCCLLILSALLCYCVIKRQTKLLFISLWIYAGLVTATTFATVAYITVVGVGWSYPVADAVSIAADANVFLFVLFGFALLGYYKTLEQEIQKTHRKVDLGRS